MNPFISMDFVVNDRSSIWLDDVNVTADNYKESIDTASISPDTDVNEDDKIFTVVIPINMKSKTVEEVKWLFD